MSVLIISDLHLSPERPVIFRAFLDFIKDRAALADALYILGDLFEAWVGDDDPSDLAVQTKAALLQLSNNGVPVYIQRGNRDFTLGARFMRESGATLLADEEIIEYYGHRALVMHGDSLCIDDVEYQRFRRKSRNPIYLWCLVHLPLWVRQKIASDWRRKSAAANSNKASAIMDVNSEAVAEVMAKHCVDTLIHGHTHRPGRHALSNGERIVLGDWEANGWNLIIDERGFELESFPIL
jgi:UDP-2,3-diacylglucosamine hydrolase